MDGRSASSRGARVQRAIAIGIVANAIFIVLEVAGGVLSRSVALLADAAHNAADVAGLALAWLAARLAERPPTERRTYGLGRSTILAAVANATLVLVAVGGVAWEAVGRLRSPVETRGAIVLVVAAIGIAVNAGSALLLRRERRGDANVRGAFVHLAADAAVSAAVVASAIVLLLTGFAWIDPAVSLAVCALVLYGAWSLLRESLDLALDAVPPGIDAGAVRDHLENLPGVCGVHDLHIWPMSTTRTALTAHLVMEGERCEPRFLRDAASAIEQRFGIGHATLQVEAGGDRVEPCRRAERAFGHVEAPEVGVRRA